MKLLCTTKIRLNETYSKISKEKYFSDRFPIKNDLKYFSDKFPIKNDLKEEDALSSLIFKFVLNLPFESYKPARME
jgi:hypothetical protein